MPAVSFCLGNCTTAAKAVALVCEVFAAPGTAVETLESLSACQLCGEEELVAASKMPLSELSFLRRKHLQCLLLGVAFVAGQQRGFMVLCWHRDS